MSKMIVPVSTALTHLWLTTAGFQMASGAGPMCEEPMWGVALELEARIGIAAATTAAGEGASTAADNNLSIELQEDVYGPFSGQVGGPLRPDP